MPINWPKLLNAANATRVRQQGGTTDKARMKHLRFVVSLVPAALYDSERAMWMEFGVRDGSSLRFLANLTGPAQRWHGFDSFKGMPESAIDTTKTWRRGQLTPRSGPFQRVGREALRLPLVPANVRLHPGWFNETLPPFLDRVAGGGHRRACHWVAFMHLDADIYESTHLALMSVCSRGMLRAGTLLSFDEIFATGSSLEQTLQHEWRALNDAAKACGFSFVFVSWMRHFSSPYVRAAVRVQSVRSVRRGCS